MPRDLTSIPIPSSLNHQEEGGSALPNLPLCISGITHWEQKNVLAMSDGRCRYQNECYGVSSGTSAWALDSEGSIQSVRTYWISIVRKPSFVSRWMGKCTWPDRIKMKSVTFTSVDWGSKRCESRLKNCSKKAAKVESAHCWELSMRARKELVDLEIGI